jgi:hypothetical protein
MRPINLVVRLWGIKEGAVEMLTMLTIMMPNGVGTCYLVWLSLDTSPPEPSMRPFVNAFVGRLCAPPLDMAAPSPERPLDKAHSVHWKIDQDFSHELIKHCVCDDRICSGAGLINTALRSIRVCRCSVDRFPRWDKAVAQHLVAYDT